MSDHNMDISGLEPTIQDDRAFGIIGAILYLCYIIFVTIILFINGRRVYSDLFTIERKSLNHRRSKPKITGTYSLILLLTQVSIFFWWLMTIFMGSTYIIPRGDSGCLTLEILGGTSGELGYVTLYLIFLARLHWLYHESKFAPNISKLILSGINITVFGIIIIFCMISIWSSQFYAYHGKINYCTATLEPITGSLVFIQDSVFSIAFLYAFYKPLKTTILLVNKDDNHNMDNKVVMKIRYSGTKTLILTLVSTIATGVLVLGTVLTDLNFIIGFDSIMHCTCLILMTPHYDDTLWYQRLCCLCLKCPCIDQSHLTDEKELNSAVNDKNNDNNNKDEALLSVDTFSQLRVTGKQLLINYQPIAINNNNNNDDVQIEMKDNVIVEKDDNDQQNKDEPQADD